MADCIVILGTTRSGTSVVTGVLHRLGVVMGWELKSEDGYPRFDWPDPAPMNPKGFFQDAPIENAQDAIWGDEYPVVGARASDDAAGEFKSLIRMRCNRGHARWGFKAHRTPWMIPELREACSDNIKFVVTSRDPLLSARSLNHWFPHYDMDICNEWLRRATCQISNVLMDEKFRDIPRVRIPFDALIDNPTTVINDLSAFLGVNAAADAISFVDKSLRRTTNG